MEQITRRLTAPSSSADNPNSPDEFPDDADVIIEEFDGENFANLCEMSAEMKEKADEMLSEAFLGGSDEKFDALLNLIQEGECHIDYRVSLNYLLLFILCYNNFYCFHLQLYLLVLIKSDPYPFPF